MFYKFDNNELLEAPHGVISKDYTLTAQMKDNYTYPIDGWYWFDTIEQAYIAFNFAPALNDVSNSYQQLLEKHTEEDILQAVNIIQENN